MNNNKQYINEIEANRNQGIIWMNEFPTVLEDAILNWQKGMRKKLKNKYFNAYVELSKLVGLAPSTIRSYTNEFDLATPTIENLVKICLAIRDNTPLEFINDYQKALFK